MNTKKISISLLILFIYIMIFKIFLLNTSFSNIINLSFLSIYLIFNYYFIGYQKDKNYLKKNTIKLVIIMILLYMLVTYLLGFFFGFARTYYSHTLINIIKNTYGVVLLIILEELIRYIILKKSDKKYLVIIFTVLIIILNMIIAMNYYDMESLEDIFMFSSIIAFPMIARECLYSYMTYKVSYIPSLIFHLLVEVYVYIVPFVPNFGNYISSVIGILFPYLVYREVKKQIDYKEKYNLYAKKYLSKFLVFTILAFLISLVILVSGILKYQMIAIATNSMNPIYYRGDAVIYEKKKADEIKVGDILVFNVEHRIITHRVIEIRKKNEQYTFITKGDNNNAIDNFNVTNENVLGSVVRIVKYIGYPTVWFNEQR